MELAELKKAIQEDAAEAVARLLPRFYEMMQTTDDPDELRKGIQMLVQVGGVEPEKKVDQFANLPRANITIQISPHSGEQQITLDMESPIELPAGTQSMLELANINEDVDFDD